MRIRLAVLGVLAVAGCGSNSADPPKAASTSTPAAVAADLEQVPAPPSCREPSGQEKASLRFAVRAHDRELADSPWAIVRRGGVNFMAAEIAGGGPRLVVLVRFPENGGYLSAMRAVNGTARTFTDLPDAGDRIPAAGRRALDCVG